MTYLYGIASLGLLVSFFADRKKTKQALKKAWKMFLKIAPLLVETLILVSIVLYFLPDHVIAKYLGTEDVLVGAALASLIGAVSLLPGFVVFPLCGLLLDRGVSFTVLAAFTTSLMMVGIVTFPIERKFFGTRLALVRNVSAFAIAIMVSLAVGILYGEVF